jgi:hypothetical protein
METKFKPLPQIELFNIELLQKVINQSTKFYIVDSRAFNKAYGGKNKNKSIDVKYEDWYVPRIVYHLNYYNLTDVVICQVEQRQYVITAQLFLLLTGNNLQAKITLENN